MRLRTAKKIVKAMETESEARYSQFQIKNAVDRMERTQEWKESERFWGALLERLGPDGRLQMQIALGTPEMFRDV